MAQTKEEKEMDWDGCEGSCPGEREGVECSSESCSHWGECNEMEELI